MWHISSFLYNFKFVKYVSNDFMDIFGIFLSRMSDSLHGLHLASFIAIKSYKVKM